MLASAKSSSRSPLPTPGWGQPGRKPGHRKPLPSTSPATSRPASAEFLKALFEGVPDDQYLEIRTMEKGRGARKKFYKLSRLREQGFEVALPGYLDGKANIYYGVAPKLTPR